MTTRDDHAGVDTDEARFLLSPVDNSDHLSTGHDDDDDASHASLIESSSRAWDAVRPSSLSPTSASVPGASGDEYQPPVSSSPPASFGLTGFTQPRDDAKHNGFGSPNSGANDLDGHRNKLVPATPPKHLEDNMESLVESSSSSPTLPRSLSLESGRSSFHHEDYDDEYGRGTAGSSAPLLTNIEAPSVTVATADDAPEAHLEDARPRSGLQSAFMNMANSIIGAGIIGQAYAFRQAGMLTGILLLVGLTVAVDWTIRLIVVNSKLSGADSFQATVEFCFGRPGLIAISLAQWAFAFGGMVAFCIIVGDTIPQVLAALFPGLSNMPVFWLLTNRRAVIVLFILGISFPLSLYRDISKLAKASAMALISMTVIVITVVTQGFRVDSSLRGDYSGYLFISDGFFQAVGVISFAFVCHHNSLLIYGSLRKPTMNRFALVTHYSTGISMAMCLAMALSGFLSFGSKTQGNVLNNFPADNILVNIARLCFGLNMLATLPLEAFVCRSVMETFYFPDKPHSPTRHLILTSALVVSSVVLSLITSDLGAVFELIGSTSASMLAYILPPLCYIQLSQKSWKEKIPAISCIAFGAVVMITSIVLALSNIFRANK